MGHRALIAYERPDETYNLHYTHWGGQNLELKPAITEQTPFGGDTPHPDAITAFDHYRTAALDTLPEDADTASLATPVDPVPREIGVSFAAIRTEHLDYQRHEALYVVDTEFEVTAYRTFWLDLSTVADSVRGVPTAGHGILATVWWYEGEPVGDASLRGWFGGAKELLGVFVDRGVIPRQQAVTLLVQRFCETAYEYATVHVTRYDQETESADT